MPATETFVVRFYRRTTEDVAGTVEAVSDGSMWSFVGFDQLRAILEAGVPPARGQTQLNVRREGARAPRLRRPLAHRVDDLRIAPRTPKSPKGPR